MYNVCQGAARDNIVAITRHFGGKIPFHVDVADTMTPTTLNANSYQDA